MTKREILTLYYKNAREQVKLGEAKKARKYVVAILNMALEEYKNSKTIVARARNEGFLTKWIAVSRDLYDVGISDYVLECFGLDKSAEKAPPQKPAEKKRPPEVKKDIPPEPDGGIDISGIFEDVNSQGWGAEIFDANKSAVVQIEALSATEGQIFNGTGFIISEKGYLLTNDHVVFDDEACTYCGKVKMTLLGTTKSYKVEVLFSDKKSDVALCKFNPEDVASFMSVKMIADYSKVKPGADCLIIGNAFGMGLAPCMGNIRFTKNEDGNLVYTIPSNPGDSGSPVFSHRGEVIGINKSKTVKVNGKKADGYANATPMDTIQALLTKWTSHNGITL